MSKDVSRLDKLIRVVGFSLYLSFIIFFIFLFFRGLVFSLSLFFLSVGYFILIFVILTWTKHIHFNVLLRRKQLKKTFFDAVYPLAKIKIFNILSWIIIALLVITAVFYIYHSRPIHGVALIVIALLTYFYFHIHNIGIHIIKEGLAFDYGQIIALIKWKEIKKMKLKDRHVLVVLKEKNIKRHFYIENPDKFKKAASKFIRL